MMREVRVGVAGVKESTESDNLNLLARAAAAVLCLLSLAGIAATLFLTYLNGTGLVSSGLPFLPFASAVVGYMVAARHPRNFVGWIFLSSAFFATVRAVSGEYAIYGLLTAPGGVPFAELGAWFAIVFRIPGPMLSFVVLPLFFPNGSVPSPRWRILAWAVPFTAAPIMAVEALAPGIAVYDTNIQNPYGVEALSFYSRMFFNGGPLIIWFVALIFLSAASLVFRYRASDSVQRQQIKWLTLSAAIIPVWFSINAPIGQAFPLAFAISDSLIIAAVPVAAGIAILRYHLYDIDFIINKALVYTTLTVFVVVVYLVLVGTLEYLFRFLTGGDSQLGIVASTLVIAAFFNPLRRLIQRFIDRRFYRRKYDARRTLDEFSTRLRDETDLEDLVGDFTGVVSKTLRPEHISVWLAPAEEKHERHGNFR